MKENKINAECITIDEMLEFVSLEKVDNESMKLIKKVNSHICSCKTCFDQINAFRTLDAALREQYLTRTKKAERRAEHPGL